MLYPFAARSRVGLGSADSGLVAGVGWSDI
jgi:hypothetical protein